ncbi:aspartate kinase [Muriicola marianensis]|uniref:Aspartokinase n=1 Tax=Muriicola marianensis TaxID=1324801 RepID=A0ABQ1QV69_9FLAO|nr:aspartate kinase [Muriicola marianensis]GGD47833.1 aspartokinase [Muriicola marianensis]
MRIFKFGGASVKDADGVKNLVRVLGETGTTDTFLVISAMGKTTNAMEGVVDAYFKEKAALPGAIQEVYDYHQQILGGLFNSESHQVYRDVQILFDEIRGFLAWNKSPKYNFVYDQVVCYGELISTTIVSAYLNEVGVKNTWLDVRDFLKTDNKYRDAGIDWKKTQEKVTKGLDRGKLYVSQGFIGSDENNFTTTLGREGSDYTAAILAYCLDANSVTIWKDVPGVLNADPRYFDKSQLLNKISYREAIELAFYGASVIHPKTLQPLQRKEIPLHVKSFLKPLDPGTTVGKGEGIDPLVPCFIVKKNQVLMKLSSLDFSFIVEDNISDLFKLLHDYRMKVDMIQNSAISFSVCVDNKFGRLEELLNHLKGKFNVVCHEGVSLYTIRHFDTQSIESLQNGKEVLLEQRGKETVQLVVKQ